MSTKSQQPTQTVVPSSPDEMAALLAAQTDLIANQDAKMRAMEEKMAALEANQTEAITATTSDAPTFKIDTRTFKVLHGLQVRDEETNTMVIVTAAQIAKDKTLREQLVRDRSTAVVKI